MSKIEYKNRYNYVFTFSKTEDGNVLIKGPFTYMRMGYPNVYDDAYEAYRNDTTDISEQIPIEKFKELVHEGFYDTNGNYIKHEICSKYGKLVYSDTNTINMIDPSGGPYLCEHLDLGAFDDSFKGMIIEQFKPTDEGYLIIVKK
jgi:hypothetical protein